MSKKSTEGYVSAFKIMFRLRGKLTVNGMFKIHSVGNPAEFRLTDTDSKQGDPTRTQTLIRCTLPADNVINLLEWDFPVSDIEETVFRNDALVCKKVLKVKCFEGSG